MAGASISKSLSLVMLMGNVRKVCAVPLKWPGYTARGLVRLYQITLSPFIGFHCRHLPTCSEYAIEALDRFGFWGGGWMTCARLCRCHPLGTSGLDFVPRALPPQVRWYIPWRYGRWRGTHNPYQCKPVTPTTD
jgi:putative membrane protein insertion efficiency factor